jgi:hypothetical protein
MVRLPLGVVRLVRAVGRRLRRWPVRYGGLAGLAGWAVGISLAVWLVWRVPPLWYEDVPDLSQRAVAEASARTAFIAFLAVLAALDTYRLT